MASITLDTAIKLRNRGIDLKIVLVMDFSNGGDALLARPEFKTLQDLKNRKIGVETTALGDYMLTSALKMAGMSVSEIKVVPLEVSEQERAFKEGRVDAVVTYEPYRGSFLANGARKIFDSSQIPGEIVDVLAVHPDVLKTGERELMILLRSWFKALEDIKKDNEQAIRFMAQREKISEKEFLESLNVVKLLDLKENKSQLNGDVPEVLAPMRRLEKIMRERRLIDAKVDVEKMLDGKYIASLSK